MNRIFLQIIGISIMSSTMCYIAEKMNYTSTYNGIWIFFIPSLVSILFNNNKKIQAIMSISLMLISFLMAGISGVIFGFY